MSADSEKETRRQSYKKARGGLEISQGTLAKWMYGEDTKLTRKYVSRKETGENPVSKTELCYLSTLKALQDKDADLKSVEFSEYLEISQLEKQKI
jgi:tRNA splicing endonuclease